MGRGKKRLEIAPSPSKTSSLSPKKTKKSTPKDAELRFAGAPVPTDEAKSRWPHRYQSKNKTATILVTLSDGSTEEKEFFQARCHYTQAIVDGVVINLFDDAYIQASEGEPDFIAKLVEMFETVSGENYICTQWFYRAKDTVIKDQDYLIDTRRVFYSDVKDDNPLSCISSKVKISQLSASMDIAKKEAAKDSCDLYVDMMYSFPHAFTSLCIDNGNSSLTDGMIQKEISDVSKPPEDIQQSKRTILDLYSGCGAMSSGLSIGASLAGETIVTRWAVDFNSYACASLKYNHPGTEVRNEDAEDYLVLLKEWENLCKEFDLVRSKEVELESQETDSDESEIDDGLAVPDGEFEVEKVVAICYGDPNNLKSRGLHFKVRWKGYGRADDTWEPIDGLSKCKDRIKEFVTRGHRARILPLPGDVDFICGGPPCQGISGFNRFRHACDPLEDKKNRQLVVFMNIVEFLKPRYVLMENVTDILKFAKGQLASYAVGRLVSMNYQTRLGIMAAGAYGVPQCRMRFFLWGAGKMESLPQFPLPTHEVLKKGVVINEFKEIIIGHGNEECKLQKTVLLGDAISDLPEVANDADQDEMPYSNAPRTVFQKVIRLKRRDIFGHTDTKKNDSHRSILYDHRPLQLNQDDFERVCHVPYAGANFRNLPGVIVGPDNVVILDPSVERPLCTSGKPLVPDYAIKFEDGKSTKPFGRLGMDDIVATVVTRAEPHNQVILHPSQDRVLSVRENARLQGFPDCYKLYGPIKERYIQVGNAVSFSVSIPLGYCLAKAMQGANTATPLSIPFKFPDCLGQLKTVRQESED
ncbi:DNA (cytosine-5-)-methyltransferase [Handroanthus impetiginosus]|uniref:DNA (cytosine-5-)-methyltransferase n=1 Tax=Handroanthus impetiginosus TaxID=429701 RepID=A0A2G9GPE6_9LAMI|nr:DNA (cytosine-5-)-methyltransferase [Handroanthus impetiginosus]